MRVRKHANPLNFNKEMPKLQLNTLFKNTSLPLTLEIGSAQGEYLLSRASQETQRNFLGMEVRKPLVEKLQRLITTNNLAFINASSATNLYILPDQSISELIVFFPDPWFKKKHHKRRIVNPIFLDGIAKKLLPKAYIYFQTDVKELYEQTLEYIQNHTHYQILQQKISNNTKNPTQYTSFFEERCLANQWDIHRVTFQYKP